MKKLIPDEALASATRLSSHNPIIPLLARVTGIDRVNEIYDRLSNAKGVAFIDELFALLDLELEYDAHQLVHLENAGAFVTVANHPFGALDGLSLIKIFTQVRPDFKVMANFLLQHIEPIRDCFIGVNPFEGRKEIYSSLAGIKAARAHLANGFSLGIFPAGEVSSIHGDLRNIVDRKWQSSAIKIVRNASVPVVPVYFDGANSYVFHLLGLIHPNLRTLTLPKEMLRKKGKRIKVRIGKPILPQDTQMFTNAEQYGRYFRAKTYALGSSLEVKRDFFHLFRFPKREAEIVDAVPQQIIEREIGELAQFKTLSYDNFDCYVTASNYIPNILREIGRLREITFRQVGEGTNKSIDLDEYDLHYNHLILWDNVAKRIAGAYRVGDGAQIMDSYGMKGFYSSTLFRMNYRMKAILGKSLELGRSFIVKDYQKHRLSLFLLWKGILMYLIGQPHIRYIIGPVSISGTYQDVSKELIIRFITKYYMDEHLSRYVHPRHAFKPKVKKVDTEVLVESSAADTRKMDKIIAEIEPSSFAMPILLKKYLQQNAKIIGFNMDPKFNNTLDGLMILDLKNLPPDTVDVLQREMVET